MKSYSPFKYIYTIGDIILLNLSITLAALLKFSNGIQYHANQYPLLFVLLNILWLLLVGSIKPYDNKRTTKLSGIIRITVIVVIIHALLISAIWVILKAYYYSREFLFLTYLFFLISIILFHVFLSTLEKAYRLSGRYQKRVVIIGFGETSLELESFFIKHPEYGYKLVGFFDAHSNDRKVIDGIEASFEFIKKNKISEVYCCVPYLDNKFIKKMIDFGDKNFIKIKLITDYRGFSTKALDLLRYDQIPILSIKQVPLDRWENRLIKRVFDFLFSFIVIILIFPWLFPIVALVIKITSKGPVFFKQDRTGQGNYDFTCYKFRTMSINGEADLKQAVKGDERITGIGKILRKTSIDEIPQFLNVLKGDMSIVGPRPHPLNLNKQFEMKIDKYMARHFVKPGITGLAQTKGYRGPTLELYQMKNRIKLDLFYIENWTIWLDVKILFMTISTILKGDENAF